jgi:hypothetical protein
LRSATASVCAPALGVAYLPNLLTKNVHKSLHKCTGAAERELEIARANYRSTQLRGSLKRVLILDDLATRGDTVTAIAKAIRAQSPNIGIIGIALGKSERKSYAAGCGYEISNEHVVLPDLTSVPHRHFNSEGGQFLVRELAAIPLRKTDDLRGHLDRLFHPEAKAPSAQSRLEL